MPPSHKRLIAGWIPVAPTNFQPLQFNGLKQQFTALQLPVRFGVEALLNNYRNHQFYSPITQRQSIRPISGKLRFRNSLGLPFYNAVQSKQNPKQKTLNLGMSQKKEITGYFGVSSKAVLTRCRRSNFHGAIAQMLEHRTCNARVARQSRASSTNFQSIVGSIEQAGSCKVPLKRFDSFTMLQFSMSPQPNWQRRLIQTQNIQIRILAGILFNGPLCER